MDTINYEEITQTIKEQKESSPELRDMSHKEIISSLLHEHRTAVQQQPQTQTASQSTPQKTSDATASYLATAPQDAKQKTQELVHYTFEHGLRAGIAKALKEDPFVLDLYHDTLTEKLYEEMKRRDLL